VDGLWSDFLALLVKNVRRGFDSRSGGTS
jgi:hypothetical protein